MKAVPKIKSQHILFDVFFMLSDFKDERIVALLNSYREHEEYLIAYNATRALGLSTDKVVQKFREKNQRKGFGKNCWGNTAPYI